MELTEFIQDLGSKRGRGRPNTFTAEFQSIMGNDTFVRHDFATEQQFARFASNFRHHKAMGRIADVIMTKRKTSVYLVDVGKLSDDERAVLVSVGVL